MINFSQGELWMIKFAAKHYAENMEEAAESAAAEKDPTAQQACQVMHVRAEELSERVSAYLDELGGEAPDDPATH